jgi:hypothetical protein
MVIEVFRPSWLRVFLWSLQLILIVYGVLVLCTGGVARVWLGLWDDPLIWAITGGGLLGCYAWSENVCVSVAGIRCSDLRGSCATLEWNCIKAIRPINILGLRYLLLDGEGIPGPLLLPLFLEEPERFANTVVRYAGADSPLARYLAWSGNG